LRDAPATCCGRAAASRRAGATASCCGAAAIGRPSSVVAAALGRAGAGKSRERQHKNECPLHVRPHSGASTGRGSAAPTFDRAGKPEDGTPVAGAPRRVDGHPQNRGCGRPDGRRNAAFLCPAFTVSSAALARRGCARSCGSRMQLHRHSCGDPGPAGVAFGFATWNIVPLRRSNCIQAQQRGHGLSVRRRAVRIFTPRPVTDFDEPIASTSVPCATGGRQPVSRPRPRRYTRSDRMSTTEYRALEYCSDQTFAENSSSLTVSAPGSSAAPSRWPGLVNASRPWSSTTADVRIRGFRPRRDRRRNPDHHSATCCVMKSVRVAEPTPTVTVLGTGTTRH